MVNCEYCKKEVFLPFTCPHCGKKLCAEHRLPENHNCPKISAEPSPVYRDVEKPSISDILRQAEEPNAEEKKPEKNPDKNILIIVLTLCIAIFLIGASYASYNVGYDSGYSGGILEGVGRGYNIRDPAYNEALQFTRSDQTDKNAYNASYTCLNFAADFKNNAFKARYRCGYVVIAFPSASHSIVCFNTTDRGLIFIEPQADEIVKLTVGQPYWNRAKYKAPDFDDTIIRFVIVW